jgi:hypothetical protein
MLSMRVASWRSANLTGKGLVKFKAKRDRNAEFL